MFKLFGTGDNTNIQHINIQKQGDSLEESLDEEGIEEEIGQVALDVLENHESIYILAPIAGVEIGDIDIAIHGTTLTISGIRNKPKEFYEHSMEIKNEECFWGKFLRNVILSENMDFSQVQAVMENNLLVIHIPKIRFDSQNIKINKI